jgi:hypothetical protein
MKTQYPLLLFILIAAFAFTPSRAQGSVPSPVYQDRGMRNNNPGNIKKGSSNWQGEIKPSSDPVFAQFESMPYGIRASLKLLLNYYNRYERDTIDKIIRRWSATDQDSYVDFVSHCTGISPNQVITPDGQTLRGLANCVFDFENRYNKPTYAEIQQGWNLL